MSQNHDLNDMHVVTENGEQCFMWRSNQLTYIAQDRHELPQVLAAKFGPLATKLDLSYNSLTSFRNINLFINLNELILDNNCLEDDQVKFKQNLRLKTLSLNKNKLTDLYKLISSVKLCFPNLEFLSLIGNPLCPSPIACSTSPTSYIRSAPPIDNLTSESLGGSTVVGIHQAAADLSDSSGDCLATGVVSHSERSEFAYLKYRYFIIYHLPNLRFLDSSPISSQERDEALKRCYWMESCVASGKLEGIKCQDTQSLSSNDCTNGGRYNLELTEGRNNNNYDYNGLQLTIMSDTDVGQQYGSSTTCESGQPKGAFTRLSYKYTGKNSEGNRFIRNQDL